LRGGLGWIFVDGNMVVGDTRSLFVGRGDNVLMEFNMDTLSVRWKSTKEKEWRGAYELSEQWKGKKVYVFVAMC